MKNNKRVVMYVVGAIVILYLFNHFKVFDLFSGKTKEQFHSSPSAHARPTVVLLHANWCGHCKDFMPTWDSFAAKCQQRNVNAIKVESAEEESIQQWGGVQGFPTVRLDKGEGNKIEYEGPRTEEGLSQFLSDNGL